ncbi:MAG: hypothetical protein GEU96_01945 [Propionibacteriales bacterium]|nr:hypothetical protein [Propionibacteriales bacterium]
MADVAAPTDDELDALIEARLRLVGVDLAQLPTTEDPTTGSPTREEALTYLRSVLRNTAVTLSGWSPPPDDPALAQQVAPPALYPSSTDAWTGRGLA